MGREQRVLRLDNTPRWPLSFFVSPWHLSQGGPGCWQHRTGLCVVRVFHDLFLQFFGNSVVYLYKY